MLGRERTTGIDSDSRFKDELVFNQKQHHLLHVLGVGGLGHRSQPDNASAPSPHSSYVKRKSGREEEKENMKSMTLLLLFRHGSLVFSVVCFGEVQVELWGAGN